ncbi:response regulator [Tepidimonas taiwanensis]|uniref:Transcriptional regulatory protein WalR n=1 Tax=Tepidimonas taiwanensis TaxID=307486 RepID=A0A554XDD4_9BURK|nr:response regulator [Tepidimonas taiwanensis]MCX7693126.1 response regulator [Tepidimonas taiwanensis]MDM7463831.1 response regulator [Tepidimonas taiwanensis]TSE33837.1 Transcriptional regulatory protein WalR [Tepidimonas taiwanensis]UBQ06628.1 response regulator [Tepidimonas taiwanensis]
MSKRVLIVDDEPNILIPLEFLMRREGYEVRLARDGDEALQTAAQWCPDLVLLDVMMPRKSGFDVCQAIRADARLAGMRIVLLTAKGRDADVAKGLALGADAYITKPFATQDLVRRVRELLEDAA